MDFPYPRVYVTEPPWLKRDIPFDVEENPGSRYRQRYYIARGQEKRKDRKTWKSRSEEEVAGFSPVSLFLVRKQEAGHRVGPMGNILTDPKDNPGNGIIKGWEDK